MDSAAMAEDAELITIFATKSDKDSFDYPGEVTVVPRDVILDFNLSNIADLFAAVPGARFDGGPRRSGQVPSVRGISGEGVLVLFDGARQSFLSGHDGRFFVDPDLLKSVEVIRGPASALYGSGALGGVIAVRTITADDILEEDETLALRASTGYQSVHNETRANGMFAWRSDDNVFDVVGSLTYRTSGDIALGNGLDLPADDSSLQSLLKLTARPSDDLTLSFSWQRFGGQGEDPNNPQGNNIGAPDNRLVDRDIDSNTYQAQVAYNPDSPWIDADLTIYHSRNTVVESEIGTTRVIDRAVRTSGFMATNRSRFDLGTGDLTLTYGGEIYEDKQTGSDNTSPDGSRGGVPDAQTTFYGAFMQAEYNQQTPIGAFSLIPALRYDHFDSSATGQPDASDGAFSPKVGLSYKPVEAVLIFANWSEAFRAPSFNEIYADGIHFQIPNFSAPPLFPGGPPQFVTNFFVENADLQPEESTTWEVGAGLDLADLVLSNDSLRIKGSYYWSNVDNLIDLEVNIPGGCFGAPFPPCGSGAVFGNFSRNVNVTNARLTGFEAELNYDSDVFYVRANFATINGTNRDTGEFVGILSPDIFFADIGLKVLQGDVRLGTRVTIASRFDDVNEAAQARDGYQLADIYTVWQPQDGPLKGIRVDAGVDNITDADYEVVNAGVSQPGRNFKLSVAWQMDF
ncbi:MAG: TonB-dependent hemoglobin/transferrin/lactoferrin family receptor [Pseudomonadota bacterium]